MTTHMSFANPLLSSWGRVDESGMSSGESCISDHGVAAFHLKIGFKGVQRV